MKKRADVDWVSYVLRDVVTFLVENEMMQSAQMMAVAAAYIEHDMNREMKPVPQTFVAAEANVVMLPADRRRLN